MPRETEVYLRDIVEAIERIQMFTDGLTFEGFIEDPRTVDAVLLNLLKIGEACKAVPEELRRRSSRIEWRKIAGMRDLIAHAYFQVDLAIVWDIVDSKLESLERAVRELLAD